MFDPLLTLIAAKTKAVGLVAGTAMITTALVGGGAVAMTAVSSEGAVDETVVVEETLDTTGSDLEAVQAVTSDTPTVGIEEPEEDTPKVPRPLPSDFTCDDSLNHGQNVSAYAKSLPKGPGRGEKVSAVAQSDCGKKAGEEAESTEAAAETEDAEDVEEVEEPKPAKAEKPAKPAKAAKPAKGKPAGKGGGKK